MNLFEAIMLLCFGASWPVAIWKSVKVKNPAGKSIGFLWLVEIGYISGILYKLTVNPDWVIALYILNTLMVAIDITLFYKYTAMRRKEA